MYILSDSTVKPPNRLVPTRTDQTMATAGAGSKRLRRAPWCPTLHHKDVHHHPLIGNTIKVCIRLMERSHLTLVASPMRPILGTPLFEPGLKDAKFNTLRESGLFQASHFSESGQWKTLTELRDRLGQYKLDFMGACQLGHFLRTIEPPLPANPSRLWRRCAWSQVRYPTPCH